MFKKTAMVLEIYSPMVKTLKIARVNPPSLIG